MKTLTVEGIVWQLGEFRQSYFLSLLKRTNFISVHTSKNCYKTIPGYNVVDTFEFDLIYDEKP